MKDKEKTAFELVSVAFNLKKKMFRRLTSLISRDSVFYSFGLYLSKAASAISSHLLMGNSKVPTAYSCSILEGKLQLPKELAI